MKLHFLAEKPHTEYLNKSNQLNETNSQMEDLEVNKTQSIRDLVPYQANEQKDTKTVEDISIKLKIIKLIIFN